jgi:hypothetical protein
MHAGRDLLAPMDAHHDRNAEGHNDAQFRINN